MHKPKTKPETDAGENDWGSKNHVSTLVLMGVTLGGVYVCYRMAVPFLPAMAWALALAVLFTPLQRRLENKLRKPGFAALVSVLIIALIVVAPALFVTRQLAQQATKGAEAIEMKIKAGDWERAIEARPYLAQLAGSLEQKVDVPATFQAVLTSLSTSAQKIVKTSLLQAVGLCLTFYLLFFFLRDRRLCLHALRTLSPLTDPETDRLFSRINDTIFATVYGTVAVSLAQGLLGGLMFWWLGLPAPLLWGAVMALLAIVPVLGPFVIWLPATLYLGLSGNWEKALILLLWGVLVVGTVDNLLRPVLTGSRLKLHTVLVFISVVGGLMLFGSAGLILGPVALTITLVLLETWSKRGTGGRNGLIATEDSPRFEPEQGSVLAASDIEIGTLR